MPDPYPPDDGPPEGEPPTALAALEREMARLSLALRRVRGHGNQHHGGLTMPQYLFVNGLLDAPGPVALGVLAHAAGMSPPTATTMVRKLERQGVVERSADASDRRVVRVALTAEGRRLVGARREKVAAWRRRIAATVDPADIEPGARVLAALADGVEATAATLAALATDDGSPPEDPAD